MVEKATEAYDGIRLDVSQWPILIIVPGDNVTEQSIVEFIRDYFNFVKMKAEPYAVIMDLRHQSNMTSKQRRQITAMMKEQEEFLEKYNTGTALVYTSAAMRGILMAVFWIFKPNRPIETFSTLEGAMDWARLQVSNK